MAAASVDEATIQSIVDTVQGTSYPNPDAAAAQLSSPALRELNEQLLGAKRAVESRVRVLSQGVAPDVDGWIARAKQVQADIEQSKATARSIIEGAQTAEALRRNADDSSQKIALLENELEFSNGLQQALQEIRSASADLGQAKEDLIKNQICKAFQKIGGCRTRVDTIEANYARNAGQALRSRLSSVEQDILESAGSYLRDSIRFDQENRTLSIQKRHKPSGDLDLTSAVDILSQLGQLKKEASTLSLSLQRGFLLSWSQKGTKLSNQRLVCKSGEMQMVAQQNASSTPDVLQDVSVFAQFLATALPRPLERAIVEVVAPPFIANLIDNVLTPSIPLETEQMNELDLLSSAVGQLSSALRTHEWDSNEKLQAWTESAPRLWLSRQREHTLAAVRRALIRDIGNLRQVEAEERDLNDDKVESPAAEAEDEWSQDWKDEGGDSAAKSPTKSSSTGPKATDTAEDESAWGWDGNEGGDVTDGHQVQDANGATNSAPATDRTTTTPNSNVVREVYTVTGVPEALMRACEEVLSKAEAMSDKKFSQSAISSAVTALYGVPTLAAALYRAMSVTAYNNVENGKLLLYNDATRLATRFRCLAANEVADNSNTIRLTTSVKRKLDQEVLSFEKFAQQGYKAEMESQKIILYDLMDGAQGFSNCTTSPFAEECENAIEMTLDRIGVVHAQWQDLLTRTTLLQSTGGLVSAAISKFMIDVQELADIGEEESKTLLTFSRKISKLSNIFSEQDTQTGETRDMTLTYCPNWLKFQYLGEVLDGSLADIKYLWIEGELSLEFDQDEVIDLIQALFADSEHRRKAISSIKSSRK